MSSIIRTPSRLGIVEPSRPVISSSRAPSNTGSRPWCSASALSAWILIRRCFQPVAVGLAVEVQVPALLGQPAEVQLEDLADVHPARDTERVQHDVDRGAVLHERHVLDRQDLRDDALVAVTAGELVTYGDLALLRDVHADQLVDARESSSPSSRSKTRTPMTVPDSPCGTFIEVSRTSRAFSPKIARSRRSSGSARSRPWA